MSLEYNLRDPPLEFKRTLIDFFFKDVNNNSNTLQAMETFRRLGYNLDEFLWMETQTLDPTVKDIQTALQTGGYGFTDEEINKYVGAYRTQTGKID